MSDELVMINVRLTPEQAEAVKRIAARTGNKQAAIIRDFVQAGLDRFFVPAWHTDVPVGTSDTVDVAA